jgi:hypothetical protein
MFPEIRIADELRTQSAERFMTAANETSGFGWNLLIQA